MKNRIIIILMIITIAFPLIGCQQKVEIINLAKVMALGIDITPDGKYMTSIRILIETPQAKGGGSGMEKGKSGGATESTVFTSTGNSIMESVSLLNKQLGKEIRFSHNKVIIIGEKAAEKGIALILDFSFRLYQMRPNIPILVAKGTAFEIMKMETPENPLPPAAIEDIMYRANMEGLIPNSTNLDIANSLLFKGSSPIAAVIKKNTDENSNKNSFKVEGTAVFKEGKLIGFMNEKETKGLEWVIDRVKRRIVLVPQNDNEILSVFILNTKTKINPQISKGKVKIEVIINAKGNIREMTGNLDIMKSPDIINQINEDGGKAIKNEVQEAIDVAQKKLKLDVFGFGEAIHRKYPKEWKKIEDKWFEQFSYCTIEVRVNLDIKRPGSIGKPIQ